MPRHPQKQSKEPAPGVSVQLDDGFEDDFGPYVERRIRFAFARFGPSVRRIRVELTQDRQGDTSCRIQLQGLTHGPLVVVGRDRIAAVALQAAMDEAVCQVARRLSRGRRYLRRGLTAV